MTKFIYIENGKINGCGEAEQLNENTQNIEIDENIYTQFIEDNLKYIYKEGTIVQNPDYQKEKNNQILTDKIKNLKLKLDELDKKRIRAVCENGIKDKDTNQTWLNFYNNEIIEIRQQIIDYSNQIN